jgi:hypothetical protein
MVIDYRTRVSPASFAWQQPDAPSFQQEIQPGSVAVFFFPAGLPLRFSLDTGDASPGSRLLQLSPGQLMLWQP